MALRELRLTLSQREKVLRQIKDKLKNSETLEFTAEENAVLVDTINSSLVIKPQTHLRGQGFLGKNTKERYLLIKDQ